MPSPKPRPVSLKLLEGRGNGRDSGGRKIKETPEFERGLPVMPIWLPREARAEWNRVVPELARLGVLKCLDGAALTAYCLAWDRLVEAQRMIADGNITTKGSMGQLAKHPAVMIAESASKDLRAWCGEFGLTPSAEARLGTARDDDDGDQAGNPFAATG